MGTVRTSEAAAALSRARWDGPSGAEQRVDALARSIERKLAELPPLTSEQRERLAALLRPTRDTA